MPTESIAPVKFHLSLNVSDLEKFVEFFTALLGVQPAKQRVDYAKFELDNPPLVLSLEPHAPGGRGALNHSGFRFPDSEALVAAQRRLEMAGFPTKREAGIECCYSRQTKFWVHDPDGGLWEFYILEGDITHRGAGQAADAVLPQVANCGPVCSTPQDSTAVYEHRLGSPLQLAVCAPGTLSEIRFRGTFNMPDLAAQMETVLAQARRALRCGGQLQIHVLTADQDVADADLSLPGPAAYVKHVPVDRELIAALEAAGFENVTLQTFRPKPCFRVGEAELRETLLSCLARDHHAEPEETRVVVYKGPFREVHDDLGRVYRRGEHVALPVSDWEAVQQSALHTQFVCLPPAVDTPVSCSAG